MHGCDLRNVWSVENDLAAVGYGAGIGLGVYDIHSPTVPSTDEITTFIEQALQVLPSAQLWVNPDCGLKTRRGEEVAEALSHMVAAAHRVRPGAGHQGPGREPAASVTG